MVEYLREMTENIADLNIRNLIGNKLIKFNAEPLTEPEINCIMKDQYIGLYFCGVW